MSGDKFADETAALMAADFVGGMTDRPEIEQELRLGALEAAVRRIRIERGGQAKACATLAFRVPFGSAWLSVRIEVAGGALTCEHVAMILKYLGLAEATLGEGPAEPTPQERENK